MIILKSEVHFAALKCAMNDCVFWEACGLAGDKVKKYSQFRPIIDVTFSNKGTEEICRNYQIEEKGKRVGSYKLGQKDTTDAP